MYFCPGARCDNTGSCPYGRVDFGLFNDPHDCARSLSTDRYNVIVSWTSAPSALGARCTALVVHACKRFADVSCQQHARKTASATTPTSIERELNNAMRLACVFS